MFLNNVIHTVLIKKLINYFTTLPRRKYYKNEKTDKKLYVKSKSVSYKQRKAEGNSECPTSNVC